MQYGLWLMLKVWPGDGTEAQVPRILYVLLDHTTASTLGRGGILSHTAVLQFVLVNSKGISEYTFGGCKVPEFLDAADMLQIEIKPSTDGRRFWVTSCRCMLDATHRLATPDARYDINHSYTVLSPVVPGEEYHKTVRAGSSSWWMPADTHELVKSLLAASSTDAVYMKPKRAAQKRPAAAEVDGAPMQKARH